MAEVSIGTTQFMMRGHDLHIGLTEENLQKVIAGNMMVIPLMPEFNLVLMSASGLAELRERMVPVAAANDD